MTDEVVAEPALEVRAARGTAVMLSSQAAGFVIQFGGLIALSRLIEPRAFGLIGMVTALVGVAAILRDFGLPIAAVQARTLTDQQRSNLLWLNSLLGLVLTFVLIACAEPIADFYNQPDVAGVVRAIAWVFFLDGVSAQFKAHLTRDMRYAQLAAVEVGAQLFGVVAAVGIALSRYSFWALPAQQVVQAGTQVVVAAALAGWWPGRPGELRQTRSLVHGALHLGGAQLLTFFSKNTDNVLIGKVWGASVLGIYSRAFQLLSAPLDQINAPLTRVALPTLVRVVDRPEEFRRYCRRGHLCLIYSSLLIFALAGGLAGPGVLLLFGPNWSAVTDVFRILALGGTFQVIGYISYWSMLAVGASRAMLRLNIFSRPVVVIGIVCGLPWGAVGVAWGYAAGLAAIWPVEMWRMQVCANVPVRPIIMDSLRAVALFGSGAALMSLVCANIHRGQHWLPLLGGLGAGIAYFALAVALVPSVRADVSALARTVALLRRDRMPDRAAAPAGRHRR